MVVCYGMTEDLENILIPAGIENAIYGRVGRTYVWRLLYPLTSFAVEDSWGVLGEKFGGQSIEENCG
jgi:hypothetical protein